MGWLLALRPHRQRLPQEIAIPVTDQASLQLPLRTACGTRAYTPARAWEPHLSTCMTGCHIITLP